MNRTLFYLKQVFRLCGLEISRYKVYSSSDLQLQKLLRSHHIGTILDVGANVGQYAMGVKANGFQGRIISFEPLSDAYPQLKTNSRHDPNWIVPDRMALGNTDGEIAMHVSANSQSSSVLAIMASHTTAAPESISIKTEVVPIRCLDTVSATLGLQGNVFMKIDVQGFELEVLKGAKEFLTKTTGLQLELSLVELYKEQPLMQDMIKYLDQLGFVLHALFPCFFDEVSGRLLQADGVFFAKA